MRIVQRNDSTITSAANQWVLSFIKSMSLHLDGQTITVRIKDKPEHSIYLKMVKGLVKPLFLDKLDPNDLKGVKIEQVNDQSNPNDLVLKLDYSGYQEPNPLNLTGLRAFLHVWVKDIYFNDWKTLSNIQVKWKKYGLSIRIPFESSGHEIVVKKSLGPFPLGVKVNIDGFFLDLHLVPYIFWFPDAAAARDKTGKKMVDSTGWPKEFWASGRGMYKHCCAIFVDFGWDSFSPNILNAESEVKKALEKSFEELAKQLPQELIFQIFETLILGEKPLINFSEPSKMRGIEIQPNDAQFLYIDEEVESFKGKGRIVAVRKDNTTNHLQKDTFGSLHLRKDYKGDNIIEVEVEDEKGKRVRISTLNLIESMLDKEAEIEDVHLVIRKTEWGRVASLEVPWDHVVSGHLSIHRAYTKAPGAPPEVRLKYNGYLRSNPDKQAKNNLDNLPVYTYDRSKPLFRNIYDGTFFFVYPDLTAFSGLQRNLYPRNWKLPNYKDRENKMLDTWI